MHPDAVRLRVLGDPGQEQRDSEHERGRGAGGDERQHAVEPVASQGEPDRERDERRQDPPARVREEQRQQQHVQPHDGARTLRPPAPGRRPQRDRNSEHRHERERVPVPDGRSKPRQPSVVAVQRRHDLPGQCPHARQRDEPAERPGGEPRREERPDERPEHREHEVGEPAVEVVPRPVGQDRPQDRDASPDQEPRGEQRERHALAPDRRQGQLPPERRAAQQSRADERGAADPGHTAVPRSPAEEERRPEQHGGRRDQSPGGHAR